MKLWNPKQFALTTVVAAACSLLLPQANAATAPALQGQLSIRPLTPQEIKDYGLTGVEGASGLSSIGIGQPAYFDALVSAAVKVADVTNVVWELTGKPPGSAAVLEESPLGAEIPPFNIADRIDQSGAPAFYVAGRKMLRPDVTGQYAISMTIQSASSGSTNIVKNLTGATYVSSSTCALCHSGGILAPDRYHPWSETLHATYFAKAIDGLKGNDFNVTRVPTSTVGFDDNPKANNGGFDDVALLSGWVFPSNLAPGNWADMQAHYPNVARMANVQCENCHGPGSEHAAALGNTNAVNWPRIGLSYTMGNCGQCHDNQPVSTKAYEWSHSLHSHTTRIPAGRHQCVRCHTAQGFRDFIEYASVGKTYATNVNYEALTCATCHDPHDASNPHQLRAANSYTLPEGTTVTNVGLGALCMECHHSRNGEAIANIENYKKGLPTWAGGSSFGPHDSTAGDMVEGVNGITYGKTIPSGSHSATIPNVCVGCHMQPVAPTDPAFGQAGGHTFSMTYTLVQNGVTNEFDKTDVCVKCHGPIDSFDFARKDYNGDGIIEGVQTEIQHLLDKLSTLLPNSTYRGDGNYIADGAIKANLSVKTNWPTRFLQAAWNWQFVNVEGSHGVHNAPYAVGLLKASIADLTGDSNNDNLPDTWQIQNFGSIDNPQAAPGATPANDGVPNWLKYLLGVNPKTPGVSIPGGFTWGPSLNNPQGTNDVSIFTAAEIVFDTKVGTTYQIQSIDSMEADWQNVGGSIPGTGGSISYTTSTRTATNQFYRVVHTP